MRFSRSFFRQRKRGRVGARHYSSAMGRFMSPDYDAFEDGPPEGIPYAGLSNPQSFNLYGYVRNNPLSNADPDGHDCIYADAPLVPI